ncbi:HAD family hydrolase [Evansella tamaricis]|uniref:HAD family hydrolase n=1 Tax=Evansella tamaricis TaxID=2069301 RepID=A0ABS6JD74_9BACI|nr:HAD family hydrolase [Evansella tamaricis]
MLAKLYIFDLDGTLYEGTDHFDYYAKRLALDVKEEVLTEYWADYESMKNGNHPLHIGKAYDVNNDLILTIDPMTLKVIEAVDWAGTKKNLDTLSYGMKTVTFDFENIVAIGDGWWLPFACAKHHGVENCYRRYLETKEYMVTEEFELTPIPGLKPFLKKLKDQTNIVLMTNSDEDDVGRLLKELDLTGLFHEVITSAQKPSNTDNFFNELIEKYGVQPEETVSIGDNFINEIAPALLMGMQAVYINEHPHPTELEQLTQVKRIHEWFEEQ